MITLPKDAWYVSTTQNKGRGVFAKNPVKKGTCVADYIGTITSLRTVDLDTYRDYLMYYSGQYAITPDLFVDGAHLINHSCEPNCCMYFHKKHILFIAIKNIDRNEELTISYMLPPKDEFCAESCEHVCMCSTSNCTGSMHSREDVFSKWQTYQNIHTPAHPATTTNITALKSYPCIKKTDTFWDIIEVIQVNNY